MTAAACSGGSDPQVTPIVLDPVTTPTPATVDAPDTTEADGSGAIGYGDRDNVDATVPAGTDTGLGDTVAVADAALVVIVDGWSAASLSATGIDWLPAGAVQPTSIRWRAATTEDLVAVARRDPDAVTALAARIVTADPTLRCSETGCSTTGRTIAYDELVDPRTSDLLGASYAAWGIDTGAWIATSDVTVGELVYGSERYQVSVTADDEAADAEGLADTGVRAVGMAFGRLFDIDPAWLGGETTFAGYLPAGDEAPVVDVAAAGLFGGLGSVVPGIGTLPTSQLTWRSSPTTGCGVGVLCVPGVVTAAVDEAEDETVAVCGVNGNGVVRLYAADVTFDYPAPTHQFGLWPARPDGVVGGRGIVWTREMPLIEGVHTMRMTLALLYDSRGLLQFSGLVADHATSTDAERTRRFERGDIGSFFDGAVRPC